MNGRKIFWLCLILVVIWLAPAMAAPLRLNDLADILPEWPVNASEAGGRLVLSDSPEDVTESVTIVRPLSSLSSMADTSAINRLRLIARPNSHTGVPLGR